MRTKWQLSTQGHFPLVLSPIYSALPWVGFTRMPKLVNVTLETLFLQVTRQRSLLLRAGEWEEKHSAASKSA